MKRKVFSLCLCVLMFIQLFAFLGFAQEDAAEQEPPEQAEEYIIGKYISVPNQLNLRKEADANSGVAAVVPKGTVLAVTGIRGEWGYAKYEGESGWIMMKYLQYSDYLDIYKVEWKVVDVSSRQGDYINWHSVEEDGVRAAILRLGRRAGEKGKIEADANFKTYYEGARGTDLYLGGYFYSAAMSVKEAQEEAEWVINKIKTESLSFDMPVFYDIEYAYQEDLGSEICTGMVKAFCSALAEAGLSSGVYCNYLWIDDLLDLTHLSAYALWIARYNTKPAYDGRYDMWNFTDSGRVNGINGNVNVSWCYTDFPGFAADSGREPPGAGGHVEGDWVETEAPSCSQYGLRSLTCAHCDVILKTELINKTEHNADDWVLTNSPSAYEDGEYTIKCLDCGMMLKKQNVPATISPHVHNFSEWLQGAAATCSTPGAKFVRCLDCNNILLYETTPTIGHKAGEWTLQQPTCDEDGRREQDCSVCGVTLKTENVDRLGHKVGEWTVMKEPTALEQGERVGTCSLCGETVTEALAIERLLGDVDGDGKVTAADARKILRHSSQIELLDEEQLLVADMNTDGKITAADARIALRVSAQLVTI